MFDDAFWLAWAQSLAVNVTVQRMVSSEVMSRAENLVGRRMGSTNGCIASAVLNLAVVMTRLFIYGTLKRGGSTTTMAGQQFVSEAVTQPGYRLYDLGGYPGMVEAEGGLGVEGELWDVDDECKARLDILEGIDEGEYVAEQVPLPPHRDELVQGYLYRWPVSGRPRGWVGVAGGTSSAEVLHRAQLHMRGSAVDQLVRKLTAPSSMLAVLPVTTNPAAAFRRSEIASGALDVACENTFQDGRVVHGIAANEFIGAEALLSRCSKLQVRGLAVLQLDHFVRAQRCSVHPCRDHRRCCHAAECPGQTCGRA